MAVLDLEGPLPNRTPTLIQVCPGVRGAGPRTQVAPPGPSQKEEGEKMTQKRNQLDSLEPNLVPE